MEIEERADEILESLWIRTQEEGKDSVTLDELALGDDRRPLEQLLQQGSVTLQDNRVQLTSKGLSEAANVVRRHRLAERLLVDVLNTHEGVMHERACKFEHLLDRGLDENICTLLGHPRVCPHGRPIPPGRCCREQQREARALVLPLSQLSAGQKGKIAYIYAAESSELQKLVATGVYPGAQITLVQRFPSYVFQIGHSQFAVDKEIANAIQVRLSGEEPPTGPEAKPGPGRHRRMKRLGLPWRRG